MKELYFTSISLIIYKVKIPQLIQLIHIKVEDTKIFVGEQLNTCLC